MTASFFGEFCVKHGRNKGWSGNNDGTHTRTCSVCSETETHDCNFGDDNICDDCGYEHSTTIDIDFFATLSLEAATTIQYAVKQSDLDDYGFDSFKLVVKYQRWDKTTQTNEDHTIDLIADSEMFTGYYAFLFENIAAKELNDYMEAQLVGTKGNETWTSRVVVYNPMTYCYNTAKTSSNAKLRTTCANMVKYAAAAQRYFDYNMDNLADANFDEISQYATTADPELTFYQENTELEGAPISIDKYAPALDGRIVINYLLKHTSTVDVTGMKLICTYTNYRGVARRIEVASSDWTAYGSTQHVAVFDDMAAADMRDVVKVWVEDANGNVVSNTMNVDIVSYAKGMIEGGDDALLTALLKAMLNYGDAARIFFLNA